MSIPTMKSVRRELKAWKKDNDSRIVTQATDVLERLTLFTNESGVEANVLADELERIITQSIDEAHYKPEFISTLYHAIQLIGFIFPRNQIENAEVLCPITLLKIQSTHLFIACDRYQFSIVELIDWNVRQMGTNEIVYRNPVTRQVFNDFDQRVLTAARERAENSIQKRMVNLMSGCLGFFSSRPQAPETRRSQHITTGISHGHGVIWLGAPPFAFFTPYPQSTVHSSAQQRTPGHR